jgi:hypothetical protein
LRALAAEFGVIPLYLETGSDRRRLPSLRAEAMSRNNGAVEDVWGIGAGSGSKRVARQR